MEPQQYLQGNLVQDPAQQVTANGMRVTRLRMASHGRRYDKNVGDFVSTDPVYMSIVCWRQLGDNVMQTLGRGDAVVVVGRVTYHEWDDPNAGGRQSRYELHASGVGPDLSRYIATLSRPVRDLPDLPVPEQHEAKDVSEDAAAA